MLKDGEIKIIDCINKKADQWDIINQPLYIRGKILTIVSDWRDISSHYILSQLNKEGVLQLTGFQRGVLTDLNLATGITSGEELIRCVTPNEEEDFVLLNRKLGKLRAFINANSHSE